MPRRKTDAEFKQEVYDLVGNEYTFLDAYINSSTKIEVKHNECGNTYKVKPNNFLYRHSRCPYCVASARGKTRIKTNAQFKHEVVNLVNGEYTFLDPYVNSYTKLRVKHNMCGHIYKVQPHAFLNGSRCPYCFGKIKKTDAQFKKEVYDLVGNEYTFIESYITNKTKLRVKHNKCGNTYKVQPNDFLSKGSRCPYCAGNIKKTNAKFKKEVYDLVGTEYTFLELYANDHTKIKVKHNKCGHIYKVTPNAFLSGKRCPNCFGTPKKTDIQFKQEVYDLVGDEYTFIDTYIDNKTKIKVKHNKCGNVYEVRPTDFFSHHSRCPYCSNPKGEDLINKILKLLGIKFEYQKTFDGLSDDRLLSYDFYIPSQSILIEYQGQQHYHSIDYFGGEDQFKIQQKHDKMKADYAKSHNYNLIAVPYTEDTFSKIKKYLVKRGLKH